MKKLYLFLKRLGGGKLISFLRVVEGIITLTPRVSMKVKKNGYLLNQINKNMNWIKRLLTKKETNSEWENPSFEGSKDPSDYTKCSLSTGWQSDDTHCHECKNSTGHNEYMSDICNSCGSFNTQVLYGRSFRKIKINGAWKYQIRYKDGREEIISVKTINKT